MERPGLVQRINQECFPKLRCRHLWIAYGVCQEIGLQIALLHQGQIIREDLPSSPGKKFIAGITVRLRKRVTESQWTCFTSQFTSSMAPARLSYSGGRFCPFVYSL